MSGRHERQSNRSAGRWVLGAAGALIAGSAALAFSPSSSAAAPNPSYHAGRDTATFTVTGVLDSNCLVSTGGTEVWIKPGDAITFDSSLAGVNVASLPLHLGGLAGLDVTAVIDAAKSSKQVIRVSGGKSVDFAAAKSLSAGNHTLSWQATGVPLASGLATLPLSNSNLQSGASLAWSGVIHVTKSAPDCKISVGTPSTGVSVGPIKVSVPPVTVSVPTKLPVSLPVSLPKLPSLPNLPSLPGGHSSAPGGHSSAPAGGISYTPPAPGVPEQVVPSGAAGNVYPGSSGLGATEALPSDGSGDGTGVYADAPAVTGDGVHDRTSSAPRAKTVDLATSQPKPSGQTPVILAILAVLALAVVAGVYARLYLLRRSS